MMDFCKKKRHREYMREYRKTEKNKEYMRNFRKKNIQKHRERKRKAYLKDPEKLIKRACEYQQRVRVSRRRKIRAQNLAERNIPLLPNCAFCEGTKNRLRHHPDYSKPLDVVTLCRSCHGFLHKVIRELEKNPHNFRLLYLLFGGRFGE